MKYQTTTSTRKAMTRSAKAQIRRAIRGSFGLLLGAALFAASFALTSTSAFAQFVGPTPLSLVNGWTNAPFGTSNTTVEEVSGIVQLRGAMSTTGSNQVAFTLPKGLRPATNVYVPVDLCNATKGRLYIQPSGVVTVQSEGAFSNAQCFTSLDGASFAPSATGFTSLTLINGWTNAPFGTSNAAVLKANGIVHFKGAIATTGTNPVAFTLPTAFRPATDVYVPIDLCGATNGRLHITPGGVADIEAENGTFSNAQCFSSLDGAWFAPTVNGFSSLALINGWTNAPFSTSNAEAANVYGIVYLKGAIAGGTNAEPFILPNRFRPVTNVYVHIDLCDSTNGRLVIQTNGAVTVQAENGTFSNAQCFTSLDGASYVQ